MKTKQNGSFFTRGRSGVRVPARPPIFSFPIRDTVSSGGAIVKIDSPRAEIDMAKIPADGNVGGLLFAIGTIAIFLIGIPAIREIFPAAILVGCAIAFFLHFRRQRPKHLPPALF